MVMEGLMDRSWETLTVSGKWETYLLGRAHHTLVIDYLKNCHIYSAFAPFPGPRRSKMEITIISNSTDIFFLYRITCIYSFLTSWKVHLN